MTKAMDRGRRCRICGMSGSTTQRTRGKFDKANPVKLEGAVHRITAVGLGTYCENRALFDQLRGSTDFARYLKAIRPEKNSEFEPADDEDNVRNFGYEMGAFRKHLCEGWLYDTFRLNADSALAAEIKRLGQDNKVDLSEMTFCVRFARMGLIEVKLIRPIASVSAGLLDFMNAEANFATCSVRNPFANGEQSRGELESLERVIVVALVQRFIGDTLCKKTKGEPGKGQATQQSLVASLEFKREPIEDFRAREKYTVLEFTNITCANCGQRIEAEHLYLHRPELLATLLEGNLVVRKGAQDKLTSDLPRMSKDAVEGQLDFATWQDDLCLMSSEQCLIYYPLEIRMQAAFRSVERTSITDGFDDGVENRVLRFAVPNKHYWRAIIRGMENIVSLRATLNILNRRTADDINEIHELVEKVIAEGGTRSNRASVNRIARRLSQNLSLIPPLRNVVVAPQAYRGGFATSKYDHLVNDIFKLNQMMSVVERNIRDASRLLLFLQHQL